MTASVVVPPYVAPIANLYDSPMAKRELLGVQAARENFAERVDQREVPDPVHTVVAKRGVPVAVIVPIDWYREAARRMKDPTEY